MHVVNITEAKAQLSALLERVLKGEQIVISKANKPIAEIVPYRGIAKKRTSGALKNKIKIKDDFDDLPDEILEAFGELPN